MSPLLITAATSKVPFYILGGAVAAWAVILAGIGLQRPDFPFSNRGVGGVVAVTVLMIALGIGAAILTG